MGYDPRPDGLRARYAAAAKQRNDTIAANIRAAGAEQLTLTTDGDWLLEVVRFVGARQARRAGRRAGPGRASFSGTGRSL